MKTPATTYCEHCGALIEADSKFCAHCGNKLQETSASQSQIQPEPPRKMEKDPTSKPLAVAGIGILAVLIGTLLFFGIYRTGSGRIPLLSDDSKELARRTAAIKLANLKPQLIVRVIPEICVDIFCSKEAIEQLEKLKAGGWITYGYEGSQEHVWRGYRIHPTDKIQPFIVFKDRSGIHVVVGKREFDEVTGITKEGPDLCDVYYTTKVTLNELAPYLLSSGGIVSGPVFKFDPTLISRDPDVTSLKHSVYFRRFDDGWRIHWGPA